MVIKDIFDLMKHSCEKIKKKKGSTGDERKICNYIQRVQQICGEKISIATICCWQALEREKKDGRNGQYIHFFCCESLGFALDISSLCLKKDGLGGSYGGSFSSSFVEHGTSVPLSISTTTNNRDIRVSVSSQPSCQYIPFAWGRTGGSKTN